MKIQGPSQAQLNIYKEQTQQKETQKSAVKKDKLEISAEAQQLQQGTKSETKRAAYVESIKKSYENGTYHVDPEKIADKMIDFWSNKK